MRMCRNTIQINTVFQTLSIKLATTHALLIFTDDENVMVYCARFKFIYSKANILPNALCGILRAFNSVFKMRAFRQSSV